MALHIMQVQTEIFFKKMFNVHGQVTDCGMKILKIK
jgi:hypothetical protein